MTQKKRVHTHNLRMLCAVGLWSRAAFFLSRYAYIILVGQPSHGKSKTILLSTRVRRQFFMRFIHPYRELSLDAIKLNMIKKWSVSNDLDHVDKDIGAFFHIEILQIYASVRETLWLRFCTKFIELSIFFAKFREQLAFRLLLLVLHTDHFRGHGLHK